MGEASTKDRILDTFVYAPLGFALYARDAAPGFARMFIARGRHEFDRHKGQVSEQINEGVETAMSVGQQAMASAPEVRRRVEGGVGQARGLVEDVVTNLRDSASQVVPNGGSASAPAPAAPTTPPEADPTPATPAPAPSTFESPTRDASATAPAPASTTTPSTPGPSTSRPSTSGPSTSGPSTSGTSPSGSSTAPGAGATSRAALPIPDYDELAASQVVERLEGLDPAELEAVADYERARRGRRTILGKIEQLTA